MIIQDQEEEEEAGGIEAGYAFGIPEFSLLDGDGGSKFGVWGGGLYDGEEGEQGVRRRRGGGGEGKEGEGEGGGEGVLVFGGFSHSFLLVVLWSRFLFEGSWVRERERERDVMADFDFVLFHRDQMR